jgi:hypothetical protein
VPYNFTSTRLITLLTYKVALYRLIRDIKLGKFKMGRLEDKLALAAGVVERQNKKIEDRADALIAREKDLEKRTEDSFSPHELILANAEQGLDKLKDKLTLLSNNPPLDGSKDGKQEEPPPKVVEQTTNDGTLQPIVKQHPPGMTRGSV